MNEPAEATPVALKKYALVDYVFQFITITAGVLIALLINGLVEWNADRELVANARATIAREVGENLKELEGLSENAKRSTAEIDVVLQLVADLEATGKSGIHDLGLSLHLATLNDSGWRSAQQTGALSHMDYGEVQRYSGLYSLQELFTTEQRKAVDFVAVSSLLIAQSVEAAKPDPQDVRQLKGQMVLLRANLLVTEQTGAQLVKAYRKFLENESNR